MTPGGLETRVPRILRPGKEAAPRRALMVSLPMIIGPEVCHAHGANVRIGTSLVTIRLVDPSAIARLGSLPGQAGEWLGVSAA